jgi:OOP family OmpA-OmpF porin
MNRLLRTSIVAALATGGVAAQTSLAQANVEIGGTAGIHVFSNDNELGVADTKDANSERNSALFGLRLGVFFGNMIGVEGEFGVIPSESRTNVFDVWNITYRGHVVVQFRADKPETKLIPFVLLGGGAMQIVNNSGKVHDGDIGKDTDAEIYFGVGAKYRVDNGWGLRADARMMFPPSSDSKSFTEDYEVLLSVYKEFGRPHVEKAAAPVVDNDPDHDGIIGDADKCPNEPEDKDGFQDDDGCPDPDNDGDGIPDAVDKCPNEPEDKDGFQDDDGCPDPDNDGDGIPDAADKCPNEPEDKDGFQDDDGCPDPDNDGDGVPDAQDKCPDQPETKNGYQDEDGCPDEIPAKLKAFTGTIQGINFKTASADLTPASGKVLDKAIAVLKEFSDLKLEVQGHTDDVKFKDTSKFANNRALSQARAESVKKYMVDHGIDEARLTAIGFGHTQPVIDPTGLKGAKLTAARAKNRRVEFKLISALQAPSVAPTDEQENAAPSPK